MTLLLPPPAPGTPTHPRWSHAYLCPGGLAHRRIEAAARANGHRLAVGQRRFGGPQDGAWVIELPATFENHEPLPVEFLKSPYPYFGGKTKIAAEIWRRLGDVPNYVEPFFGGGSILLKRPADHPYLQRIETVNDKDGMISNFWRALQADPEAVARFADWPVNENDLHARHYWLVQHKDSLTSRLEGDPDYYDTKIAGWWVWGMALWIGSGFCSGDGSWQSIDGQLVHLGNAGRGVQRKLVHLGDAGRGVQRQRVHLGNAGMGVQRQLVHLGNAGREGCAAETRSGIYGYFAVLSERLRRVRVCSGDWTRVLGDSPTIKFGITAVVLDPPYTHEGRNTELYNEDHVDIAAQVRQWAVEHGDDPLLRIVYCGYEDGSVWPDGWTSLKWKPDGGFDGQRKHGENNNRNREIIWFSPHCLKVDVPAQLALFADPSPSPSPVPLPFEAEAGT